MTVRVATGVLTVAMVACLAPPAHAQSRNLSGEVALGSQLVDRGLAITQATPTLQGAVAWTSPAGWSFGVSGGAELRSPGNIAQSMAQASRFWSLSTDWQMQASALYYRYSRSENAKVYNRAEGGVTWLYRDVLTFGVSAVRVMGARDHQTRPAADVDFHWPIMWQFSLSAGLGFAHAVVPPFYHDGHMYGGAAPYRYGHVGLMWSHGPWRAEFDRIQTDLGHRRPWGNLGASSWVGTISRSF
jgi:hypothetical protein